VVEVHYPAKQEETTKMRKRYDKAFKAKVALVWRGYDKMDMKLREKRKGSCPEGSSTRSLRSQP